MKRVALILTLLLITLSLCAGLPDALSREGNPELYDRLMSKAKANIHVLPSAQGRAYNKLLKQHDDILMAYLIAYESNANLAQAEPDDLLSNYIELQKLLDKEGLRYDPEFFLSYVAKQTVSDERISAYRKAMLDDGLREVLERNPDILDRYRATASWCVEKLKFQQTSGRDMNPLDITQKSLLGRCEEMQILFVAAARVVGIPSRPASTPWWAHIDNNHAWAEVYLDDQWAYTGDMDAAYFPNQTWFSGLIDKTVLILADGSMPTNEDEVLFEGDYEVVINSTRNYAKERTRNIEVRVLDEAGEPAADALISVMVFNWGALRTLSSMKTREDGSFRFSAGRGAFYLSAYKDGKQALALLPSSESETEELSLRLSSESLSAQNAVLHYPANAMDWQQAPQSYAEDINHRKQLWQAQVDAWTAAVSTTLLQDEASTTLLQDEASTTMLQDEASTVQPSDSLLTELLIQSRGNYPELQKFIARVGTPSQDFMDFLLSYDPKFLWQADHTQLEACYNHFLAYPRDADYPAQVYYPTMFYEELSRPFKHKGSWQLYPKSLIRKGKDDHAKLAGIIKRLHKRHKIDPAKALQGLLRLDVAVGQKHLTNYQFRMLTISALRANGIAAEYTRVPDNILVYLDHDWHYYDAIKRRFPEAETEAAGQSLKLSITDEAGLPLKIADEQISLTRLVKGQFYSLTNRFEYLGNGRYQALIKDQDAYLQFGYRISDSQTAVQVLPIQAWDGSSELKIVAKNYPRTWQPADPEILALFDPETLETASLIILGNHDQENSLRLLDRVRERSYLFFGYAPSPTQTMNYRVLDTWQDMVSQDSSHAIRSITLIKKDGSWLSYEGRWDKLPD